MASGKNKQRFEIIKTYEFLMYVWLNLKNNQILLNKIAHRFLMTTKLFTGKRASL
jgi:hypothetical protein